MIPRLYPFKYLNKKIVKNNHNRREWFHENIVGNTNLLICIGDSWTWGDSLGKTDLKYNDIESRYEQFYIAGLAKNLKSDWVMIAQCGTNNQWILEQYKIINQAIKKKFYKNYNKIYVHVCLTELFRELDNDALIKILYKNLNSFSNFKEFCNFYFKITVMDVIKKLAPIPKLHSFSKNFWNVDMKFLNYNFLERAWQDILFEKTNIEDKEPLPVLSSIGIDPLVNLLEKKEFIKFKNEFNELLIRINKRIDNMMICALNHKKATKHPTADAHQIWADYLYNYYKDL